MQARRRSGNSMIELTFMMPWLVFLFVGVFDFGFYAYALIATQNAARAAAVHNSISSMAADGDPDGSGCRIVIAELQYTPNIAELLKAGRLTDCGSVPLQVTSTKEPDPSGAAGAHAAKVVVTYQTDILMSIPGVLPRQMSITRTAWMRVNPSADF